MRNKVLIATCIVVLVGPTWWLLATDDLGARVATVLAIPVGIAGLIIALFGISFRSDSGDSRLSSEVESLRIEVTKQQLAERQKVLADSGFPNPADVTFEPPDMVTWRSDGDRYTGSLSGISEFYKNLRLGRLLILGEAGAGKTVLANHLLIQLINLDDSLRVPVQISLPSFDPGNDYKEASNKELSDRLDAWLSRRLANDYGVPMAAAKKMVKNDRILPVLDGLDEMDKGEDPPNRAASVMRALNYPAGASLRPVIMTCRTDRYKELMVIKSVPGRQAVLQDVGVIRVQPLNVRQVTLYIATRFRDPVRLDTAQARWRPVLSALKQRPNGTLARAMSSPLRLFMVITAYHNEDSDPSELIKLRSDQIDPYLFTKLIPAVIEQYPFRKSDADDGNIVTWLRTFALYLTQQQDAGGSGSDIDLQLLWTVAGKRTPRTLAALVYSATEAAICCWLFLISLPDFLKLPSFVDRYGFIFELALIPLTVLLFIRTRQKEPIDLRRLDLSQLLTSSGRRRIGAATESSIEQVASDKFLKIIHLLGASQGAILIYPIAAILNAVTHRAGSVRRPSDLIRQGLACDLTLIFLPGLIFSSLACLISGFSLMNLFLPLGIGMLFPLAYVANSPWLPYFFATQALAREKLLPRRPARFLDWAYEAGLMRMSGISVQFRHRELQNLLIQTADTSSNS